MSRVETPRTYPSVTASATSAWRRAYRPSGAVAAPPARVRPTRTATSPAVVTTCRSYRPFRTSTRWSLRSYGPALVHAGVRDSGRLLPRDGGRIHVRTDVPKTTAIE